MRASVHTRYGAPDDVLRLEDVAKPTPRDDEILIRVRATTVNRTDTGFLRGAPFIARPFSGLRRPTATILGSELAGEVEAVGRAVTSFAPRDPVFGLAVFGVTRLHFGAHAEYLCLPESWPIVTMPAAVSFEDAAAVCDGLMLAMAFIRRAGLRPGQRILVNGASGSIGSAAVQLAKYYGTEVTAVCGTEGMDVVASLGADAVIDFTREDFTRQDQAAYDAVLDAVGKSSLRLCRGLLKPGGVYLSSELGFLAQNVLFSLWPGSIGGRKVRFPLPSASKADVRFFGELLESGKYRAVIDRRYPLEEIVSAYKYVETGQKIGNIVITV
ncbi:MAG TPA: NAD(P)-dependent alcohol dehydrogenase [Thermoleophilia bacterium]|nr:NAD(P)-dependent alcohol dehydrogenase [Thermoleophilia bacterium]